MTGLLILGCAPLAMLTLGGWWRRFGDRRWSAAEIEAPKPGEIPLARLVRHVFFRLDGKATRQFVRLQMAVADELTIGGDRQVLEELLYSLCLQAIETAPCGSVLVAACRRGEEIAITVADDGIGVPSTRSTKVMGAARETLALLGGRIEAARKQGAGATITMLLPTHTPPWDATIQNAMADFSRIIAPRAIKVTAPVPGA